MLVQLPGQQTCLTASGAMNFPSHAFRLCRCMQAPLGAGGCTPQPVAPCRCSVGTASRPHPTAFRLTPCPESCSVSGQCWLWRNETHRVHHCRPACHGPWAHESKVNPSPASAWRSTYLLSNPGPREQTASHAGSHLACNTSVLGTQLIQQLLVFGAELHVG